MSGTTFGCGTIGPTSLEHRPHTLILGGTAIFREGLRCLLAPAGFLVLATGQAIDEIALPDRTDEFPLLIILCLSTPYEDELSEIRRVKEHLPDSVIACLCCACSGENVLPMLESGATTILLRSADAETLIESLELALLGNHVVPYPFAPRPIAPKLEVVAAPPPLEKASPPLESNPPDAFKPSPRELKIIECLVKGESNRVIAGRLLIPEGRVKGHVKAILRKINAKNRTQAAIWGMKRRIEGEPLCEQSDASQDGHPVDQYSCNDEPGDLDGNDDGRARVVAPSSDRQERSNHLVLMR